jgi:adenylosuccinate synthase
MKAISRRALTASQCRNGVNSNFCLVLGLQWGYEGKDKLLDKLCPNYDYSCRYNGGVLKEPTELENGDEFLILPNGVKHQTGVKCLLGNGVVIEPYAILKDFSVLSHNGIGIKDKVLISDRAHIVTAFHHLIAQKLLTLRGDSLWLKGEDITQSFKTMKMGLRMTNLVEPWADFE